MQCFFPPLIEEHGTSQLHDSFHIFSYLALDPSEYMDLGYEMSVAVRFRPSSANGVVFLAGNKDTGDFVALELRNQYLVYR